MYDLYDIYHLYDLYDIYHLCDICDVYDLSEVCNISHVRDIRSPFVLYVVQDRCCRSLVQVRYIICVSYIVHVVGWNPALDLQHF